jgi:hypothetical protein
MLTLPLRGLVWIFEEVHRQAEQALYDEDALRDELTRLYQDLERGTVSEEEFAHQEAALAERLEEAARRQRRPRRGS